VPGAFSPSWPCRKIGAILPTPGRRGRRLPYGYCPENGPGWQHQSGDPRLSPTPPPTALGAPVAKRSAKARAIFS
jgi:hypothetical protein